MAHTKGTALKFYPNTGTYGTPSYTAMEGETTSALNISHSVIPSTDKDDNDWNTSLNGLRDWSVNFTCRGDTGNSAQDQILDDIAHATAVPLSKMQFKTFDSNKYAGDVWATDCTLDAGYDGLIEMSGTVTGTGPLTQSAA